MKIRVSYYDTEGLYHTEKPLGELPPIERLRWVRREWSYSNQKHTPLMFYFSTLKKSVYCESYLEAQTLLDLDYKGGVKHIVEQPLVLHYNKKFHIPDYVYRNKRSITLVNVKPLNFLELEENVADFALASEAAKQMGWEYQTRSELNPQYIENLGWLASFKDAPLQFEKYADPILEYLTESASMLEVLRTFNDDFLVKPVIFYLLWHRHIHTDLNRNFSLQMRLWAARGSDE